MPNKPIRSYSVAEIEGLIVELELPRFRAQQLLEWLYVKGVSSYDEMTNLPLSLRQDFAEQHPLLNAQIVDLQISQDGTQKLVLCYSDGALVETVAMPSEDGRLTVCCSTQAGCAMACSFCATGKQGLTRNLVPGEMVEQVKLVEKLFDQRVSNVVLMGQGEPFANFDHVISALQILNDSNLGGIGARHITVSTCGLIEGITKFADIPQQFTLAVSLHSARQNVRNDLMPTLKTQTLSDLKTALFDYCAKTGRRVSFEYSLMKGINDAEIDLRALIDYTTGLSCHVNLLPLNDVKESFYKPSVPEVLRHWQSSLEAAGVPASIRRSRGSDIAGACGQLANSYVSRETAGTQ